MRMGRQRGGQDGLTGADMLFLHYLKTIKYPVLPSAGTGSAAGQPTTAEQRDPTDLGPGPAHESGYLPMQTHVDPGFPHRAPSGVLWAKHNLDLPPGFEISDLPKYGSVLDGMAP
eukprot:616335-Alexandrium_andersonii.AAC.1